MKKNVKAQEEGEAEAERRRRLKEKEKDKRQLLYHNTANVRPAKRRRRDVKVPLALFEELICTARSAYHHVSFDDFAVYSHEYRRDVRARRNSNNRTPKSMATTNDTQPALISTQRALDSYLDTHALLEECMNAKLDEFDVRMRAFERNYDRNHDKLESVLRSMIHEMQSQTGEAKTKAKTRTTEADEELLKRVAKRNEAIQRVMSIVIPNATLEYHLDDVLNDEDACGAYAVQKEKQAQTEEKEKEGTALGPLPFTNADNKRPVPYTTEIFKNLNQKRFVRL